MEVKIRRKNRVDREVEWSQIRKSSETDSLKEMSPTGLGICTLGFQLVVLFGKD